MRYLFLRCLPWMIGLAGFLAMTSVWRAPDTYPWPLGATWFGLVVAFLFIGWGKLPFLELLEKLAMPALAFAALILSTLLAEQPWERIMLDVLAAGLPIMALELLFLSLYQPTRYPVNALSRLNLALVPVSAFCLALGLVGMQVFITDPQWTRIADPLTIIAFALLGFALAFTTSHPTSDRSHRVRWATFGALIGLHVGILCVLLPVSLSVIASLAALGFAWPIRARRYGHEPKPSTRLAWTEGIAAMVMFVALLLTSRWA